MNRRDFLVGGAVLGGVGALGLRADGKAEGAPLKVAFFSDVHAREGAYTVEQLSRAAEQINSMQADVLIGGGDYLHGGFGADEAAAKPRWEVARGFLESLQGRRELVAGNHDLVGAGLGSEDPYRVAREELGIPIGARRFTVGDFTFLCLDSVLIEGTSYRGAISQAQLDWMDGQLSQIGPEDPILIVTHLPFRTLFHQAGPDPLKAPNPKELVANANAVLERFRNHNLLAVLQGHLHLDEHLILNNCSFITGGAVCGGWWNGPNRGTYRGSGLLYLGESKPGWSYSTY